MQPFGGPILCFIDLDSSYFIQLVVVGLFLVLMHRLLFRPLLAVLDERRRRTGGDPEEVNAMTARAHEDIARYEAEIFATRNRRAEILAKYKAESRTVCRARADEARQEFERRLNADLAHLEGHFGRARRDVDAKADVLGEAIVARLVAVEKDR